MRRWGLLSLALFAASMILLGASVATGDGEIGLFLIFPFIIAQGPIAIAGAVLLMMAVLCMFIGMWRASEAAQTQEAGPDSASGRNAATKNKFGGVVLIGPIPIAFGSDKGIAKNMLLIGAVLFIVLLIAFLILVHPLI